MAFFIDARLCVIILCLNYASLVVSKRSAPVQIVEVIARVPDATDIDEAGKEVEIAVNDISPDGQKAYPVPDVIPASTYEIQVEPVYANEVDEVGEVTKGSSTPTFKINTPKFVPELSVRAIPVSPDTILVTVDTVGGDKVDKLRILYSDDSAIKWTKVDGYNKQENYALVAGLQPSTTYVFNVSATVNNESRCVVRHVLTPGAGFSRPTNISVTEKTNSSILITWNYDGDVKAKGFLVLIDNLQPDGSVRPVKQYVVFKENEAFVDGLDSGEKYQVKVEPFDLENGTCSDPVLFQIHLTGETTSSSWIHVSTTASPEPERSTPPFFDPVPKELRMIRGQTASLTCEATETPHSVVQWYKDNVPYGKPADGVNEIVLSSVEETTLLTCTVNNGVETIVKQIKLIVVRPEREPQAPSFNERLPETLLVGHGSDVRLGCSAAGSPVPLVSWYKNNALVVSAAGSAEFAERRASKHFDLKCVAENKFGLIEAVTKVYIRDLLRNPSINSQLPSTIEKYEGEQLMIPCSFHGEPTPVVTWYNGDTRLGDPVSAQNILKIDSVNSSTVFTCRGENLLGKVDKSVQLRVIPKEEPNKSDYKVVLKEVKLSPTEVKVKWAVNEGNLKDIRHFDVKLVTDRSRVVLNQRRGSNIRSETFSRLLPQTRYTVNVQTVTARGVVDNSSVEFTSSAPDLSNRKPVLYLDIAEVRDNRATVEFSAQNLNPQQVLRYRVRVKDLDIRALGDILNTGRLVPDTPFILESLKPNRNYQVIIDALSRRGSELLTAIANFSTPAPGEYGTPVFTSSETSPQPHVIPNVPTSPTLRPTTIFTRRTPPTVPRSTTTTRRTPPTVPPRTLPTTAATEETTTQEPFVIVTTGQPAKEPENHDYVMTTKIRNKTPESVDIRWAVDRGALENINNFLLTIKGDRGNVLLQLLIEKNQRIVRVGYLSPNTRYIVNMKAIGTQGDLVESEISFQIDPADAVPDTSNPVLVLEANEVRAHRTRIDLTAINAGLVRNFKITVLDSGPGGSKLLTQMMHSDSHSLILQHLEPNKRYYVILEALAADKSVLMTSSLTFETPSENQYGVPVSASSRAELQQTPVAEQLSTSQIPQQVSHQGKADTSSDPVLEMRVNPGSDGFSLGLTCSTQNLPVGLVAAYILKIRNNGPQGDLRMQERLSLHENLLDFKFEVIGLTRDNHYFLELDAVSQNGSVILSASTLYVPGRNVTPFHVTSKSSDSGLSHLQSQEGGSQVDDDDGSKPEIDLELTPLGHNQVRINWTVINEHRRRPTAYYKLKVHRDGPEGHKLHEYLLPTNKQFHTVYDLLENTRYYIQLDAIDQDGRVIKYVGHPYLMPPPGHALEPSRTTSMFNKNKVTTTVTPVEQERLSEREELVISRVEAEGSNSILVEWHHAQAATSKPVLETNVRYAEFSRNPRGPFKMEVAPAGQQRLVIRHLKPNTTYGIQVAPYGTLRWSGIVFRRTGPM